MNETPVRFKFYCEAKLRKTYQHTHPFGVQVGDKVASFALFGRYEACFVAEILPPKG